MRCVITGVNGVVGYNLKEILFHEFGWDIIGVGSGKTKRNERVSADISDSKQMDGLVNEIKDADIFIHCAAVIDSALPLKDLFSVNVLGAINAFNLSRKLGVSLFVNISSVPVIGNIVEKPITENHPCNPETPYHLSKLHGEEVLGLLSDFKTRVVNFRIPSPVGKHMHRRTIFPILLDQAAKGEMLTVMGDSRRKQNFLDVRDLARAVELASKSTSVEGVYNIAAGLAISNKELAEKIIAKTDSDSNIRDNMRYGLSEYFEDWDVSSSKAKKDFGYTPVFSLEDSITWVAGK